MKGNVVKIVRIQVEFILSGAYLQVDKLTYRLENGLQQSLLRCSVAFICSITEYKTYDILISEKVMVNSTRHRYVSVCIWSNVNMLRNPEFHFV